MATLPRPKSIPWGSLLSRNPVTERTVVRELLSFRQMLFGTNDNCAEALRRILRYAKYSRIAEMRAERNAERRRRRAGNRRQDPEPTLSRPSAMAIALREVESWLTRKDDSGSPSHPATERQRVAAFVEHWTDTTAERMELDSKSRKRRPIHPLALRFVRRFSEIAAQAQETIARSIPKQRALF